jgi:hypothetical protein
MPAAGLAGNPVMYVPPPTSAGRGRSEERAAGSGTARRRAPLMMRNGGARMTSDELRRKAAQCLRLANGAVPNDVADWLHRLAAEYEDEARRLESADALGAGLSLEKV